MFSCLLAFTAAGDDCWTALRNHPAGSMTYGDAIAHEGKIFAVSLSGHIYFWDMNVYSDRPTTVPAEVQPGHVDQRPPSAGLHVRREGEGPGFLARQKVPCQARQGEWNGRGPHRAAEHPRSRRFSPRARRWRRRVADLGGDRALFVGRSYPFYAAVTCGCSGLKANSVYAADLSGHAAIVLDLRRGCAGSFEPLVHPNGGSGQLPTREDKCMQIQIGAAANYYIYHHNTIR
ncbi:uncharacterized protein C2845_PM16G22260 [Panicum miliaceum]|uniref:KIB1-4 beta-propeller domain-containing protein n=1 Tax=Panicum miliaceum TaxID=4540 RepID=A0A3L6PX27_PANMI|nr:uncharacterized protein C2845_PM16G22260 [Panicum miliaceum]